jgi:hypothetical protein
VTDTVSTKCGRAFLHRTFLYNETAFPPTRATVLQFLTKAAAARTPAPERSDSLSNVVKNFHNAHLSSSGGRITDGKDLEAKFWRHNLAVHAELVGCRGDLVSRLTQEDPETMWRNHYGRVSVNPSFAARWAAKAPSIGLERLTVDERLCVCEFLWSVAGVEGIRPTQSLSWTGNRLFGCI